MQVKLDENMPRLIKEIFYKTGAESVDTVIDEQLEGAKDQSTFPNYSITKTYFFSTVA